MKDPILDQPWEPEKSSVHSWQSTAVWAFLMLTISVFVVKLLQHLSLIMVIRNTDTNMSAIQEVMKMTNAVSFFFTVLASLMVGNYWAKSLAKNRTLNFLEIFALVFGIWICATIISTLIFSSPDTFWFLLLPMIGELLKGLLFAGFVTMLVYSRRRKKSASRDKAALKP